MKYFIATILLAGQFSFAGPKCVDSKDKWLDQTEFQKKLTGEGYKIKKFKVTSGNCYEIYGHNKMGQKVEIYYNPITGAVVKQEIED